MKNRLKIMGIAIIFTILLVILTATALIWLIIWLFTGFDIVRYCFDNIVIPLIKKTEK